MQVVNAVMPTPAQIGALAATAGEGPITMLNLLKFKAQAAYEGASEPPMSGREAYMRYGEEVQRLVAAVGGRVIFNGRVAAQAIGDVEDQWDAVALVEYPSAASFVSMAMSEPMQKIAHHRKAGLEGQLLIMCRGAV